jgi:hypothetical protein
MTNEVPRSEYIALASTTCADCHGSGLRFDGRGNSRVRHSVDREVARCVIARHHTCDVRVQGGRPVLWDETSSRELFSLPTWQAELQHSECEQFILISKVWTALALASVDWLPPLNRR